MSRDNFSGGRESGSSLGKVILIALLIVAILGFGGYFVYNKFFYHPQASGEIVGDDLTKLKKKVGKLLLINENEEASATIVNNAAALKAQGGFFSEVSDGDRVLILMDTQRVIIWRPSENKLINVGPIINDQATDEAETIGE